MPTKPESAFPNPAAVLPGEADILAKVIANLADHTAKLIYADWLEERGDLRGLLLRNFINAYREGKKLPSVKPAPKPWCDLVGITMLEKCHDTPLKAKTDHLLALAKPALTFNSEKASVECPIGASKFGGRPDMSVGMQWPSWNHGTLSFLGQFNLTHFSETPVCRELPTSGLLSVFYDTEGDVFSSTDEGGWRLLYFPDTSSLKRSDWPSQLGDHARFPECGLTFTETTTLPRVHSPWKNDLSIEEHERDAYSQLLEEPGLGHRMLGYAHSLQSDVQGSKDFRHLFTIDSDDAPGWMWGDTGLLYFVISEEDLRQHRFDRTQFEMQCC